MHSSGNWIKGKTCFRFEKKVKKSVKSVSEKNFDVKSFSLKGKFLKEKKLKE